MGKYLDLTTLVMLLSYGFRSRTLGSFVMLASGLMRVMEPLLAGKLRKDHELEFQTLKRILES